MEWNGQNSLQLIEYNKDKYHFREWFCEVLGCSDLENLHNHYGVNAENYRQKVSEIQKKCDFAAEGLSQSLENFFADIVEPVFGKVASRQLVPTFRSHFSVTSQGLQCECSDFRLLSHDLFLRKHYFSNYRPGIFHRDKDYGLLDGTVNLWLPVTAVAGTNSLWIGSQSGYGIDAAPITMNHGQCLFFDGATRWHGAVWNTSNSTRVSFDVRFIPKQHLRLGNP